MNGREILAANLKTWRQTRKMTQERLSELTGLSRAYLNAVENGHCNVSLDNLCEIAAALDIHPRQLLEAPEE